MKRTTVNVRESKRRLSHDLRLARAGESVEITERGVPIGRIVTTGTPIEERVDALTRTGLVEWDRRRLPPAVPVVRATGPRTVRSSSYPDGHVGTAVPTARSRRERRQASCVGQRRRWRQQPQDRAGTDEAST